MYNGGVLLFPLVAGDRSTLGLIEFSCVIDEEHTVENEITGYPVETGFIVADHAIKKNRKISLNIIIGNTLNTGTKVSTLENSGLTAVGTVLPTDIISDAQKAHDAFTVIAMEARECQVSTIYGVYNNAIITKYSTKQNSQNISVLMARLDIVDTYQVDVTGTSNPKGSPTTYSDVDVAVVWGLMNQSSQNTA